MHFFNNFIIIYWIWDIHFDAITCCFIGLSKCMFSLYFFFLQEIGSQEFVSPKRSFFSRFLSLLNPASCGIDASERKSPTYSYGGSSSSRRRRKVKFFSQKDRSPNCIEESVTRSESEAVSEGSKRNMDHFSDNPNGSHILDKASTSHDSAEYLCYLTDKSVFMSAILFEFFGSCLPNIVKGCQWILLYR